MGLFLGSFLAFKQEAYFPTNREMEFCCSYVKLPYHRDHRPTAPFTWRRGLTVMYRGHVISPTELRCSQQMPIVVAVTVTGTDWYLANVLRPVCTAHPILSFYWLQNSPSPQVISHRLLINPFLNFVIETQSWALLRFYNSQAAGFSISMFWAYWLSLSHKGLLSEAAFRSQAGVTAHSARRQKHAATFSTSSYVSCPLISLVKTTVL